MLFFYKMKQVRIECVRSYVRTPGRKPNKIGNSLANVFDEYVGPRSGKWIRVERHIYQQSIVAVSVHYKYAIKRVWSSTKWISSSFL